MKLHLFHLVQQMLQDDQEVIFLRQLSEVLPYPNNKQLFHIRRFALNRWNQLECLSNLLPGPPENKLHRTLCTADAVRAAPEGGGSRKNVNGGLPTTPYFDGKMIWRFTITRNKQKRQVHFRRCLDRIRAEYLPNRLLVGYD